MGFWRSLAGSMIVEILCASIEELLLAINKQGVTLNDIIRIDDLRVQLSVRKDHFPVLQKTVERFGGTIKIRKRTGFYWSVTAFKYRPVLFAGLILYIMLALYLPTRIFFVQVEGNRVVSSRDILDQAEDYGVRFGAVRSEVRNEKLKNALLSEIPELQWVGVNTYGCVAVISVKERSNASGTQTCAGVSSIVAKCDGIIEELVVTRGNVLCKIGQAVVKDQVLVSGYTDCGISIKATAAEAEVYARTSHDLQVLVPLEHKKRTVKQDSITKFSLIFGKKQIKLYKDSGISDMECVKMYEKNYLTLPGGFVLPVGIEKETLIFYDTEDKIALDEEAYSIGSCLGTAYLMDNMVAGEIISSSYAGLNEGTVCTLSCRYSCREMIGKVLHEEIITADE